MPTTPNFGLRYPIGTDSPAGHTQLQNLAEDTDDALSGLPIIQAKKSIIAAEQNRAAGGYGYLGTNDKVTGIVLPADGLIAVLFDARWWADNDGARAAIFLDDGSSGSNQYKARCTNASGDGVVAMAAALSGGSPSTERYLHSAGPAGIASHLVSTTGASDVTTGQGVGLVNDLSGVDASVTDLSQAETDGTTVIRVASTGPTFIKAAAGTYEVGVKFKPNGGAVYAEARKLWVWTIAFD